MSIPTSNDCDESEHCDAEAAVFSEISVFAEVAVLAEVSVLTKAVESPLVKEFAAVIEEFAAVVFPINVLGKGVSFWGMFVTNAHKLSLKIKHFVQLMVLFY